MGHFKLTTLLLGKVSKNPCIALSEIVLKNNVKFVSHNVFPCYCLIALRADFGQSEGNIQRHSFIKDESIMIRNNTSLLQGLQGQQPPCPHSGREAYATLVLVVYPLPGKPADLFLQH